MKEMKKHYEGTVKAFILIKKPSYVFLNAVGQTDSDRHNLLLEAIEFMPVHHLVRSSSSSDMGFEFLKVN